MTMYAINQDGGHYDDLADLNEAIGLAEELLGGMQPGTEATFTVENEDGYLMAAVTNRRIVGSFNKETYDEHGRACVYMGTEEFDATDTVLLLEHAQLVELQDGYENTDHIGKQYIDWAGPCSVSLVDAICDYFGVGDLEDITPEALLDARNRAHPQPQVERTLTLTIKVTVRVSSGASVDAFVENLDYSLTSNTAGVVVAATEIVEAN